MINIVCLKWGTKFTPQYVNRLYYGFKRNTTLPFTFHCFTDDTKGLDADIVTHPLPRKDLEGWWYKVYFFSKEFPISGRIFFADLDTLIVGNVDHILMYHGGFAGLRDFYKVEKNPQATDFQSSVMSFNAHEHSHIWENFIKDPIGIVKSIKPHGDQTWIGRQQPKRVYWQDLYPNQFVSYKVHCLKGLPEQARIVCYHGIPSIADSITKTTRAQGRVCNPAKWVEDYWRD